MFSGWYAVKIQGPQMVRDQKKFGNHWCRCTNTVMGKLSFGLSNLGTPVQNILGFRCVRSLKIKKSSLSDNAILNPNAFQTFI